MQETSLFLKHIAISAIGTTVGILIGGVLGIALARLMTRLYLRSSLAMTLATLFPSRTILLGLLVPYPISVFVAIKFGLGIMNGIVSVAVAVAVLTTAFSFNILVAKRFPKSQLIELVSTVRTLSTLGHSL